MSTEVYSCPFTRKQRAFLISSDPQLADMLTGLWAPECMEFVVFDTGGKGVEAVFAEPPDILVVDNRLKDMTGVQIIRQVKSENVYRQLPVIVCLDPTDIEFPWNWNEIEADDFLVRPLFAPEARDRVFLTLARTTRALDANPLSRLPGNTSIIQRIQHLIERQESFALGYCDLDYFKSFNDKYGFSRGDEVLMMAARVIANTVKGYAGKTRIEPFVGHVGGDDFVFILPSDVATEACEKIIKSFDAIVPNFYDADDRRRGYIVSKDRQDNVLEFPLMAISIAVVMNIAGKLEHYGQASSIAMALKKKAKENPNSSYVIDQRRN